VLERDTIFVVDDDPSFLKGTGRLLAAHGFAPRLFSSAEAFRAETRQSGGACLLLDIQLGGMSGVELGRELSRTGASMPIIFVTADDSESTRRSAMAVGCAAYLTKPVTAAVLLDAIRGVTAAGL
jgi:FixJ family two-component response regulator